MTEFRSVTPEFSVAPQLSPGDLARVAELGFRFVINNRPDGEGPDQPTGAEMKAAAEAAGIEYRSLPFVIPPPPAIVAKTAELIEEARGGPVLAYCRTGTRSVTAWAMAQALQGERRPDELIALAGKAGYDLSGARGALERLAPPR